MTTKKKQIIDRWKPFEDLTEIGQEMEEKIQLEEKTGNCIEIHPITMEEVSKLGAITKEILRKVTAQDEITAKEKILGL